MTTEPLPTDPDLTQTPAAKELAAVVEATLPAAKPPEPDWKTRKLQDRIAKLTAQNKALEARAAQPPAATPEAEVERQVAQRAEVRAAELAAQRDFESRTGRVLEAGRADFPDFLEKIQDLQSAVIEPTDEAASRQRYTGLVNGIMETADDDPKVSAKLFHMIGSDPEIADRLAKLSPVRLGKELAKMAEQPPPEPQSQTPRPPSVVVGGRTPSHVPIDPTDPSRADRLSMSEWMARRNAQIAERRPKRA
jgi:hypothetical protein